MYCRMLFSSMMLIFFSLAIVCQEIVLGRLVQAGHNGSSSRAWRGGRSLGPVSVDGDRAGGRGLLGAAVVRSQLSRHLPPGPLDRAIAPLNLQLWVTQLAWMAAVALPSNRLPALTTQATLRAPHRLHPLPLHRAVPAQAAQISVLMWHHPIGGQPMLELHLARPQIKNLWDVIQPFNGSSVSLTTAHP